MTLADHGGKTEITLHSRAVALTPEGVLMLGGREAGWSQSLRSLEDVLTGSVDRQIVIMRMLEAPRERVFEAFTTRDQVEQWWGPDRFSVTTEQMDVRPGGIWRFTMQGPTIVTMKAVFDSTEARDLIVDKYNAIEGGTQTLGRLEAFLAGAKV